MRDKNEGTYEGGERTTPVTTTCPKEDRSTVPEGSGRVDMLTSPVAAARGAVATGAWVKSKHDMYLIRGRVGA